MRARAVLRELMRLRTRQGMMQPGRRTSRRRSLCLSPARATAHLAPREREHAQPRCAAPLEDSPTQADTHRCPACPVNHGATQHQRAGVRRHSTKSTGRICCSGRGAMQQGSARAAASKQALLRRRLASSSPASDPHDAAVRCITPTGSWMCARTSLATHRLLRQASRHHAGSAKAHAWPAHALRSAPRRDALCRCNPCRGEQPGAAAGRPQLLGARRGGQPGGGAKQLAGLARGAALQGMPATHSRSAASAPLLAAAGSE
jgi:hypothetical protein